MVFPMLGNLPYNRAYSRPVAEKLCFENYLKIQVHLYYIYYGDSLAPIFE